MRQIQHLYRIESALRENKAGPDLRHAVRSHQSRPIVERIKKALLVLKASRRHVPQSLLGLAIDYALGQWPMLEVFLRDGKVEIDNNLVENAIRPTAIGKKNWLFIGEAGAGQRGAIIYSLIESCRKRVSVTASAGGNAYLTSIFGKVVRKPRSWPGANRKALASRVPWLACEGQTSR